MPKLRNLRPDRIKKCVLHTRIRDVVFAPQNMRYAKIGSSTTLQNV